MRKYQKIFFTLFSGLFFVSSSGLVTARTANDPYIQQWGYDVVGLPEAWNYTTGSRNVVVAVIDNGIVTSHPDLSENIWHNPGEIAGNGLDDDNNGYIDDTVGWDFVANDNDPTPDPQILRGDKSDIQISHATAVAGIIGAVGNNMRDGAGIAWQVQLMNVRAADNEGNGENQGLADAIRYAVKNGADIINLSVNSQHTAEDLTEALKLAIERGVAVFASGGNNGQPFSTLPTYPVCSDKDQNKQWVIGVSAVGADRRLANFSNFGSDCIDLTAPGADINSASWYKVPGYVYGWNGTSFATPFASGAAALLKALRPEWKAEDIYRTLMNRVGHSCSGGSDSDYRDWYGNGLLRIDRAVRAAAVGPYRSNNAVFNPAMLTTNLWVGAGSRIADWALPTTTARVTARWQGDSVAGLFADTTAITMYRGFPCTRYFAVAKTENKKQQRITIYDGTQTPISTWVVNSNEQIFLAFVKTHESEPQVAVATGATGKIVADLYDLQGKKTGTWQIKNAHRGVTALTSVPHNGELWLAAIVNGSSSSQLLTAQGLTTVGATVIPKASYRLAAGDFNATGEGIIAVAPQTINPKLKLYTVTAEWQLGFTLAAPAAKWDWIIGDYNDDVRADIVMFPTAGTSTARVYDYGGRQIDELDFFVDNPTGRRWLLWP